MFLFWCAVGRSMFGGNGEGTSGSRFAAGIQGKNSADSEPRPKEVRKKPEVSISWTEKETKKASTIGPLQSLLDQDVDPLDAYLRGNGNGAEKTNDRHSIDASPVQSPNRTASTDGNSSPPVIAPGLEFIAPGASLEVAVPDKTGTRVARPKDLHVQQSAQLATKTRKSGTERADTIPDDIRARDLLLSALSFHQQAANASGYVLF